MNRFHLRHLVSIGSAAALLLTSASSFAIGAVANDTAAAPMMVNDWVAEGPVRPIVDVPTDGYVDLGVRYNGFCDSAQRFEAIEVAVTLDGALVEGTLAEAAHLGGKLVFQPSEPFEPNRNYRVYVEALSSPDCAFSAGVLVDQPISTASGPAIGALQPTTLTVTDQRNCGWRSTWLELSSEDAPYVTYDVMEGTNRPINVIQMSNQTLVQLLDECVDVTTTHTLTGETLVQRACPSEPTESTSFCRDEDEGCSGATPGQNWPMLGVVAALMVLTLRRRRAAA